MEAQSSNARIKPKARVSLDGMIRIDGESFFMGSDSPEAWQEDGEGPVREVTLSPFLIDACVVTNRQYEEFVNATGYRTEAEQFGWSYVFHLFVTKTAKKNGDELSRAYRFEATSPY